MKSVLAVSLTAIALAGCASKPPHLPTQSGVALGQYAGTWYEQARLPNRFQDDCAGDVRADYVMQPDGTIRITNQCRTRDGKAKIAQAEGRQSSSFELRDPARLEVRFAPGWMSWLPMVWGDYWILRLEEGYRYSLVGTPDRKYLWVLSRDKRADPAKVDALLEYAGTLGFDVNAVVRTSQ